MLFHSYYNPSRKYLVLLKAYFDCLNGIHRNIDVVTRYWLCKYSSYFSQSSQYMYIFANFILKQSIFVWIFFSHECLRGITWKVLSKKNGLLKWFSTEHTTVYKVTQFKIIINISNINMLTIFCWHAWVKFLLNIFKHNKNALIMLFSWALHIWFINIVIYEHT